MIPEFDIHGVLPPIRGIEGSSLNRSPYTVGILEFCQRFGTSTERRSILRGLLTFWGLLRQAGLGDGFQWIDSSFVEDVESSRQRAPKDVDVVTFCRLGDGAAQRRLMEEYPTLFPPSAKDQLMVDHYFVPTDSEVDHVYARKIGYWYSMWSNQRDTKRWKGFICVILGVDDQDALSWLEAQ